MVIIGLGNPGEKFEKTKHNAGFMAVDFFVKKNQLSGFEMQKKLLSEISKNKNVILAKPQTFMNKSGEAAKKVMVFYKLKNKDLLLINDDSDLPLGKIKFSKGSGSGGHKGVDSVIKNLKKNDFARLRIGIGNPKKHIPAEKIVLQKLSKDEEKIMKKTISKVCEAMDYYIKEGLEKTMNIYNR